MRSQRRTRVFLGFAVLVVGALLAALAIGTNRSAHGQDRAAPALLDASTPASTPAAHQRDVQSGALRREVALLRREVSAARIRDVEETQPEPEMAPGDATERERLIEQDEARLRAQAEATEAALRAEPADPAWSNKARDLIAGSMQAEFLKATKVVDIDCRSTLCRVRVTNPDPRARMVFEHHFGIGVGQLLPQLQVQTIEHDDGSATSIVYLAREGHDFPSPRSPAGG
jgi:hypothetical protein